ncbi:MAG: MraY family glycosyltransferase [Candidatus Falkowbacteria bacterium]
MSYFFVFLLAFIISAVSARVLQWLAPKVGLMDLPRDRHQHDKPTPFLGGVAVFIAVVAVLSLTYKQLLVGNLAPKHWLFVLAGATLLVIGGILDDKFKLKPSLQLIFPLLACVLVVMGGVNIEKITNPFGGFIYLDQWQIPLFTLGAYTRHLVVWSDALVILWLFGMMFTTKLLDGLDGLVSGVGVIASIIIFIFTMSTRWYQPDIAWASLVLAGACAGFLYWNWYPAKQFLGESGALLIGFLLGVLSIISGGKFAVALLIMGIPILDVAWTIVRRTLKKQNPFRSADRQHLHFRLLDAGLSTRQAVTVFYGFAALFGGLAIFLQSKGKLMLLAVALIIMVGLLAGFAWVDKRGKAR